MNTAIFLIGAAQAFFLVILILSKRKKQLADYILALWLCLLGVHLAVFYKFDLSGVVLWYWRANAGISFIQGPFLYLYSRSLIYQKVRLLDLLHFLPFIFYVTTINFLEPLWLGVFLELVILSFASYLTLNLLLLRRYRKRIKEKYSNIEKIALRWLNMLTVSLSVVCVFVLMDYLIPNFLHDQDGHNPVFIVLGLFVIAVGYFGLSQGKLLVELSPTQEKYASSSLDEIKMAKLIDQLRELMHAEKTYLEEELNLLHLSKKMGVTENDLSQSFSHFNTTFYDFVNQYRVDHAKELISSASHNHLSLLGIAFESGFQSKATFNRAFKKHTGQTPSAFKKHLTSDESQKAN